MFKRCLENRVIKNQWGYKCVVCKYETFNSSFAIIDHHINSPDHMKKLKSILKDEEWESMMIESCSNETARKNLVENDITFNQQSKGRSFKCHICNCMANCMISVFQHIHGKAHVAKISQRQTFGAGISKSFGQNGPACEQDILLPLQAADNNDSINQNVFNDIRHCEICDYNMDDDASLRCHTMIHILSELKVLKNVDIIKCTSNGNLVIKCLLCNEFLDTCKQLKEHLETDKHLNRVHHFSIVRGFEPGNKLDRSDIQLNKQENVNIQSFLTTNIKKFINCRACNIKFNKNTLDTHTKSEKHIQNLNQGGWMQSNVVVNLTNQLISCFLCQVSFDSLAKLINHYNQLDHKLKMYCASAIIKCSCFTFLGKCVYCQICSTKTEFSGNTMEHLFGKKHQELQSKPNNDRNSQSLNNNTLKVTGIVNKSLPNKSSSLPTSDPQILHSMLNNLVIIDKKKSPAPKMSKIFYEAQSKLNSFSSNVLKFGRSYVKFCIEPGPLNIYNLDIDQINLLKLGISLMYPTNSKQYCIPCGKQLPLDKNSTYDHLQDSSHINILKQLIFNDEEFEDYPDQFSDLRLAKEFIVEINTSKVQCCVCNVAINNDNTDISLHTETSKHISKIEALSESSKPLSNELCYIFENIWYYAQFFICDLCNDKCDFEIDFIIHLLASKHANKVKKNECMGITTRFGFCPVCVTFWYGTDNSHELHCEALYHIRFMSCGDFVVPNMSRMTIDMLQKVDAKSSNLEIESNKMILEKESELELLKAIEDTVKTLYPDAKAYTFGSRLSNLGFPDSDVDVFLDCQNGYNDISDRSRDKKIIMNVKKYFEDLQEIWIIDEILLATRVPILKLRHIPTSLKCDISFTNGLSVDKSTLVGDYNNAYRECRLMILYLKKLLTSCKLAGSEGITTFATSWLVIFYLQTKGILPSVHELIILKNESKIVDGWECGFTRCIPVTPSTLTLKDHLLGFFSFYVNYDYRTNVICPYLGISLKKKIFAQPELLPGEYNLYKSRLRSDAMLVFRFDSPMCAQDPIDLSQNMTKAVTKLQLRCFKEYCMKSYQLIKGI